MFKIGDINVNSKIIMAPMAGVSNPSYMKICEEMGCNYFVTELISAEAVVRENKKTFDMLNGLNDVNGCVGIQIFGSNPKTMGDAAKILEERYDISFIDINMGCPVPKVALKNDAGSALLKDLKKIKEIVTAVVSSVSIPVTVKIRSGWDDNSVNAVAVSKTCEDAGASLIAVHARTRSQGYGGKADWNIIKQVKNAVSIPVIGNGDVKTVYDAQKMLIDTGCDAVMIGRALLGNPWLIKECIEYLKNGIVGDIPSDYEKIAMIKKHYEFLKKYSGEKVALLEIRHHALWYIKGIKDSKKYKNLITGVKDERELLYILKNMLDKFS